MLKALDFCCGAGGLTQGLLQAGIPVLAGLDKDPALEQTYSRNNAPSPFLQADLTTLELKALRAELGITATDQVLYAAGLPCQPYSNLNPAKTPDPRSSPLAAFLRLLQAQPPEFLLLENVPGLSRRRGQAQHQELLSLLTRLGYQWNSALLDAKDYSVPQTRKRYILLAAKNGPAPAFPPPSHGPGRYATVRQAIANYPALRDGETNPDIPNHTARPLQPQHRRLLAGIPKDGGRRQDLKDPSLLLPAHQALPATARRDVFGRMAWAEPAPTLTTRCGDVYCGRFGHPEQERGLSLREAAALQTFPEDYVFYGKSFSAIAKQIGNAVPPKLAQALGQALRQAAAARADNAAAPIDNKADATLADNAAISPTAGGNPPRQP